MWWSILLATVVSAGPRPLRAQVAENPDPQSLISRAGSQLADRNFDAARRIASQAAELAKDSPEILQASAEILYLAGFSKDSLPLFDRVVELSPKSAAFNWQRGIALCSQGDFKRGAAQFKTHHDVNPDDVENSAWYFLCIAKTDSMAAAKKTVIPSRGDSRQPMMSILQMLKGEIEPKEVLEAAEAIAGEGRQKQTAKFYADLYVGLYYDSLGDKEKAAEALRRSQTREISGYMVDAARVYLQDRFGKPAASSDEPSN